MWDVALSTMWGIGRFERLGDFFLAGRELGFGRFELNHGVNSKMLAGVDLSSLDISSVHEPCPADVSTVTLKERNWLVSAPDPECRQQGVRAVKRSIDLAQELGASLLVVHPGRVDVDSSFERKLWDMFETGQSETPEYEELKESLALARAGRAEANLEAARLSLAELAEYAGRAGVLLGLENRYHYLDIPLLGEIGSLLDVANDGRIGFWYDVGHGQVLENLGFDAHEDWLRRYADRMLGMHLHDVRGLKDHLALNTGEVDWDMVLPYIPDGALRTFECQHFTTPEQLVNSLQFLADRGFVRPI